MTLEQASRLAEEAHAGQVDRTGRPYAEHVFAVRDLLAGHGERAQMAGVLHDVLEDTPLTAGDLRARGCPEEVVRAVEAVTRREGEPYEELVRRAAADPLGRLVKLADNAHNSDGRRLALLPAGQAERLRAKYARARRILEEGAGEGRSPGEALPQATLLALYTDRVEECRAFYAGLGLSLVRERHGSGPEHHAAELAGGMVLEIYPAAADRSTGAVRLGLTVEGRRAAPPLEPGRRVLTDPDGRRVDLRVV
jgi:hypothetical protein